MRLSHDEKADQMRNQASDSGGRGPSDAGPAGEPRVVEDRRDEIDLLQLGNVLLRHRSKVVGTAAACGLLAAGLAFLAPTTYTAGASFMPQTEGGQISQLSGIAAQFGVNVPQGEAGESPPFYEALVTSREILEQAVHSEYRVPEGDEAEGASPNTARQTLIEFYGIEASDPEVRAAAAVGRLRGSLNVETDPQTSLVSLSVTTSSAMLSRQVADRLLELVNQFNLETRQSRAAARAEFIEGRLETARRELRAAEDSLERFLERNRSFRNSPQLQFEHDRLQRRVGLKQGVVTSLAQSHEQAQIDRVRNTPVITVIESPDRPVAPDRKNVRPLGILGLLLGGLLGLSWAFGIETVRNLREKDSDQYREVASHFRQIRQDGEALLRRARAALPVGVRSVRPGDEPRGDGTDDGG